MSRQRIRPLCIAITLVALLSTLAACGGSANALLGKWEDADGVGIEFRSDSTFSITAEGMSIDGTYEQEGNQVTLTIPDMGDPAIMTFAVSGDTMTMTDVDGEATEFTRVK